MGPNPTDARLTFVSDTNSLPPTARAGPAKEPIRSAPAIAAAARVLGRRVANVCARGTDGSPLGSLGRLARPPENPKVPRRVRPWPKRTPTGRNDPPGDRQPRDTDPPGSARHMAPPAAAPRRPGVSHRRGPLRARGWRSPGLRHRRLARSGWPLR